MVGIDQTLVDIEAKVDDAFLVRYGLSAGHSLVIDDAVAEALYAELMRDELVTHQFAGGTIGNTLHNFSVLADDRSVLLGVMCNNIQIGGYAYRYLCNTSSRMDLNYLQGVDGAIGRCFTLIGDQGDRTFAISPGQMNQLRAENVPEDVIAGASALVLTSYLILRGEAGEPMPEATLKAIEYAKRHNVPVVLTLGTKHVIGDNPQFWRDFLRDHVSIVAMNEEEALALTGEADPLLASDMALEWVDLVLCTAGPTGLYMGVIRKRRSSAKRIIRCCLARLRSSTCTNLAGRCVNRTASSRYAFFLTSPLIWAARKDHEYQRGRGRRTGRIAARYYGKQLSSPQRA